MSEIVPVTEKLFQVKEYVVLKEDVHINRPGAGSVLYAAAGTIVRVMSYDPSKALPYGVRTREEGYRNAAVSEEQLDKSLVAWPGA